jgi:hypothetical protein
MTTFRRTWRSVLGGSRAGEEGGVGKALSGSFGPGGEREQGKGGPGLVHHTEGKGRRGGPAASRTKEEGDPGTATPSRVA